MAKIFISYRRQDTQQIVGRIFDRLSAKFGRDAVFMDIDKIPWGADFHDYIAEQVGGAAAVVVAIGSGWLEARDSAGLRRLDDPADFVRLEIEAALRGGVPTGAILIDGARMPGAEHLPDSLRPLCRRNALEVSSGRDFHVHMDRLIADLERRLSGAPAPRPEAAPERPPQPAPRPAMAHPYLANGYEDKAARLVRTFTGHTNRVISVAFSSDGRQALSGSRDNTLKLWDVASGRELRSLMGHTDSVASVAFSPEGRQALSGSWDNTLKLWDVASGREVCSFTGHAVSVNSVAFSPDGRYLASGGGKWDSAINGWKNGQIKLWVEDSGSEAFSRDFANDAVFSVSFSPDGRFLLTGHSDSTLKLWDVTEWTQP